VAEDVERVEELLSQAMAGGDEGAEAITSLTGLAEGASSGAARKAARRALHKLESRGVKTHLARSDPPRIPEESAEEAHQVLASPIDGAGNRGIWFAFRRGPDVDFVSLLLNDEEGVKDAFARDMSVSRFDREARRVLGDAEFPWIEMPVDYARHLVERAHRLNATSKASLPLEFLAWRDRVSRPRAEYEKPIIYSVVNAAEVRWDPRHLDNSAKLYELDLFKGWILDRSDVAEFVKEGLTAERTGLVLAGSAGEARSEMIEDRAVQALFDARRRGLYKFRLEEMAYLLWKLGRLEAARSALAAALALEPPDRALTNHPFLRELVHWSLEIVTEMAREERTRSIKPGVRLHLP
jgi:hypothetical protein